MRNPDPISRLADETGDSIAEHSDDESMTNAPDTPDVGNVSNIVRCLVRLKMVHGGRPIEL